MTHPLQAIREPIAPDSLQLNPKTIAEPAQGANLATKATTQMRIVHPHDFPSSKRPRLVLKPDRVKYCKVQVQYSKGQKASSYTNNGNEQDANQVFDFLHKGNCKPVVVWYDKAGQEPSYKPFSFLSLRSDGRNPPKIA